MGRVMHRANGGRPDEHCGARVRTRRAWIGSCFALQRIAVHDLVGADGREEATHSLEVGAGARITACGVILPDPERQPSGVILIVHHRTGKGFYWRTLAVAPGGYEPIVLIAVPHVQARFEDFVAAVDHAQPARVAGDLGKNAILVGSEIRWIENVLPAPVVTRD